MHAGVHGSADHDKAGDRCVEPCDRVLELAQPAQHVPASRGRRAANRDGGRTGSSPAASSRGRLAENARAPM
jgi:hypothetical protein